MFERWEGLNLAKCRLDPCVRVIDDLVVMLPELGIFENEALRNMQGRYGVRACLPSLPKSQDITTGTHLKEA